jgi:hypothetical protein
MVLTIPIKLYRDIKIVNNKIKPRNIKIGACRCSCGPCTNSNDYIKELRTFEEKDKLTDKNLFGTQDSLSCQQCKTIVSSIDGILQHHIWIIPKIESSDWTSNSNDYTTYTTQLTAWYSQSLTETQPGKTVTGFKYITYFDKAYKHILKYYKTQLQQKLQNIKESDATIDLNRVQISTLRKNLENKQNILIEQSKQVQSLSASLISKNAQANLKQQDTVTIGLPYLPFFKMSNRNYVFMMFIINILLIIGIILYSFLGVSKTQDTTEKTAKKTNSLEGRKEREEKREEPEVLEEHEESEGMEEGGFNDETFGDEEE